MNHRLSGRLIASAVLLWSTAAVAGPFAVSAGHQLKVDWNGQPLITTDQLSCIGPDAFKAPEGGKTAQIDGWTVHNAWRVKAPESAITYRREVAVNDREVELTIQFRIPAYYQEPEGGSNTYVFSVPLKALEGLRFQAISGRGSHPKNVSGQITAGMPEGSIVDGAGGSQVSFVAFEGDGKHLVFDFNLKGPETFNDYGPTNLQGLWRVDKVGNELRFYFGRSPELFGGVLSSKVRIIEGTFDDFSKWHAHRSYRYYSELPTIGAPLTMAAGSGDKTLDVNVPEPGIYLFTIRNNLAETGPFTLSCDGKTVARDIASPQGKMQTITFSRYTVGRQIKLAWHGKWAQSTVAVQALIYKAQDFAFKRGVWLDENIPTPTDLFMFKRSMPPASGWTYDGQAHEESYAPIELAAASVPAGQVHVPSPNDPARAWRWDGSITGLGPGNFGSFHEFDTDALINRRLDELQKLGYRIILLNGLIFRHCWPAQMPRVEKTIARIVQLAHQRGMKVLDHQDLSVVCYKGAGFNELVNHLDWTQRDVRTGVPTRGWCLDNPQFNKNYFNYLSDWVKNTGLDGVMIDETTFHGQMFCGCEYCREKFHHDTGVYLPYSGKVLMNRQDRLWKLWLSWRMKTVGDWYVALRQHLEKANPNVVIMKYTTNYGLLSDYASVGFGGSLPESARAVGFLGTEIMSRNVWASYRSNLAAREAFNSLRFAFGSPIFGLVYPVGQPAYAYAGWIQNNMRGQVTWAMVGDEAIEKDARRYSGWKENMDLRHARSLARTALLFSLPSRNFPRFFGHGYALIGTAEQLDDQHIPYRILLNRDLTAQKLKQFKLLILPSACSMSDAELTVVHDFLRGGGKVLSLGHSAVLDELGDPRKTWSLGAWIGLAFNYKLAAKPVRLSGSAIGQQPMDFNYSVMEVMQDADSPVRPQVLAEAKRGKQSYIVIAQGSVGKGTLLVVIPRLGEANCQREMTINQTWNYEYDPQIGDLFGRLIHRLVGDEPDFKAVQIPLGVRTSVYEQPAEGGRRLTLVHLYNGTGVHIKKGEKVPQTQPAHPFPPVEQDLVFEIALPGIASEVRGEIVSPDFSGTRAAKVESLGSGRYRVTVPKGDLIAYDIVRLRG